MKKSIIFVSILIGVAIIGISVANRFDQYYVGCTIDELLDSQYSGYITEYINEHEYYFIAAKTDASSYADHLVIRHMDDGNYKAVSFDPAFPVGYRKATIDPPDMTVFVEINALKERKADKYILQVQAHYDEGSLTIRDSEGTWDKLNMYDGVEFYYRVVSPLDERYSAIIEYDGITYPLVTGEELVDKLG